VTAAQAPESAAAPLEERQREGNMKVAQIARMVAKPGRRDDLIAALEPAFAKAEQEAGTEVYLMMTDARTLHKVINPEGGARVRIERHPDEVWFFELYESQDAVTAHEQGYALTEGTRSIGPRLREVLAEPHTIVQADLVRGKGY
jgi:quinol monooxygenase YgiN